MVYVILNIPTKNDMSLHVNKNLDLYWKSNFSHKIIIQKNM